MNLHRRTHPPRDETARATVESEAKMKLKKDCGHKICSAHILGSPSTDTNAVSSIDGPSSPRQLPLARQTDHSSVKRA
ncbi:hypothetical protein DY000_02048128 [Brassica cretica]|uniref:Uncharacterized protein n=1 Tax=Brassica cretica TaxID=69181 RepID=A0ABQ7EN65_BRACR|nr:hypothetical protein DY000_02048128 [Brassica cretica]